ncbi:MAG: FMN-binding protein [Bacilli bacterium]|nr:FMN-binding protein [Bacilli bacterium]
MKHAPKSIRYSLFLLVLGIIAGILLATVNSITAPIIEERKENEIKEALQEYFTFDRFSEVTSSYSDLDKAIEKIYIAYSSNAISAVIYQVSTNGYGGEVITLIGIDMINDKIIDVKAISATNETSGIGSKVIGHDFGVSSELVSDYSFEIIAGASVSSGAVKTGVEIAATHYIANKTSLGNGSLGE